MWRPGICGFPCERGRREYPTDRDHQRQRPIRNAPSRGATSAPGYALRRRSPSRSSSWLSRVLTLIVALQVIPVFEGGNGTRLHYHLILDCPRDELRLGYVDLISRLWTGTDWGHKKIHVHADSDAGWYKYMSKFRDKPNYADSIDYANCHVHNR